MNTYLQKQQSSLNRHFISNDTSNIMLLSCDVHRRWLFIAVIQLRNKQCWCDCYISDAKELQYDDEKLMIIHKVWLRCDDISKCDYLSIDKFTYQLKNIILDVVCYIYVTLKFKYIHTGLHYKCNVNIWIC